MTSEQLEHDTPTHSTVVAHESDNHRERLLERLSELNWSIAVAESLTGGLVAADIISVPGASAHMRGGVVAYGVPSKHDLLGVNEQFLADYGAVHQRVARQMAEGVRSLFAVDGAVADVGLATTGVAGPDSSGDQPVGTVFIAVATPLGTRVEHLLLDGDRQFIRVEATKRAILLALHAL